MNGVKIRMGIWLSTCTGLLLCLAGCPDKPHQSASVPPPQPTIIAKSDLENLKKQFAFKLRPERDSVTPGRELTLVNFVDEQPRAHVHFEELQRALERMIVEKGGRVTEVRPINFERGEKELTIRYENHKLRGHVVCHLRHHHQHHDRWEIDLAVKESPK